MITIFRYTPGAGCEETHDPAALVEPAKEWNLPLGRSSSANAGRGRGPEPPFSFHPLAVEDCWHEPQHPKVDDYGDYVFMVVHGVRYDAEHDEFKTHELNIFLGASLPCDLSHVSFAQHRCRQRQRSSPSRT